MVDKEGTYDSGKVRMYEELISGKEVVDLSPPQALDRAKYFLVEQGLRRGAADGYHAYGRPGKVPRAQPGQKAR
jgi:hypothetical protein